MSGRGIGLPSDPAWEQKAKEPQRRPCFSSYGVVEREQTRNEIVIAKWVDVSDANYGVTILNNGRNGFDAKQRDPPFGDSRPLGS